MSVDSIEIAPHHGWLETKAEVTSCVYIRASSYRGDGIPAYYAVGFTYRVNGKKYADATASSVEVQLQDKLSIRYNPDHPDQNNSLASVCDRPWFKDYIYVVGTLVLGLTVYGIVSKYLLHH
jgi:hypothetical protein